MIIRHKVSNGIGRFALSFTFLKANGKVKITERSDDKGAGVGHVYVVTRHREYTCTIGGLTRAGGTSTTIPK